MAADALANGVGSVLANKSVLSNTVFPIDLVPVKPVLTAQGVMVAGMAVVLLGLVLTGSLHWTIVILPVIWFLQIVWLAGINWFLSLFNVVFRDLQQLLTAILMMLLVASPFAYTPAMVPPQLRLMILLNPFAYFVIAYQKVLVLGELPTMTQWLVLILITLGMFGLGSWFFNQTKRAVIDYV
jgi:lipopolysaccharide transport system permease protein